MAEPKQPIFDGLQKELHRGESTQSSGELDSIAVFHSTLFHPYETKLWITARSFC